MRKITAAFIVGLLVVVGFGCSAKKETPQTSSSTTELPAGHPSVQGGQPSKPVNVNEVSDKITKALDQKYPGEWKVSGNKLSKGSYTENGNYGIADEAEKIYPGSMVSIFVGQERISGTVKGQDGKRVLSGYQTPEDVDKTMKSGKASVVSAGSINSAAYQKVFLPLKSGNKTVAVMSISIVQ